MTYLTDEYSPIKLDLFNILLKIKKIASAFEKFNSGRIKHFVDFANLIRYYSLSLFILKKRSTSLH